MPSARSMPPVIERSVPVGTSVGTFELRTAPVYELGAIAGAAISVRDTTTQKRRAKHELVEITLARTFSDGSPAEVALTKALETRRRIMPAGHWMIADAERKLRELSG